MTTYYVKPTGDNGLDGQSEANAWETITYALTQMIANDVLNIAAGAYAETVTITTEHITLTGAGSGLVTINKLVLDASYPTVSGLTATAADSICSYAPVTNITLDDVVGETQTTLPWADAATITNCDFTGLVLPLDANAAAFTNTIIRCLVDYGISISGGSAINITFENTTILGNSPSNGSISISNGTNTVFTDTTFEDPDAAIKVTSGATATFIQNNRKVLVGTVGTNTVTATESTLIVADGTYDYRDFIVTPDASIVISETSLWETSGDQNKAWKVEATGARTVTFRLTDMLASTSYDLKVDDVFIERATSDASGVLSFDYTGTFSEKAFTVTKTNMACHDTTPWTQLDHPHTINRLRVTAGGSTNQTTGEWTAETTSSIAVCGSIGYGLAKGVASGMIEAELVSLAGGQFKTGDQCYACHQDCDIALNDILESYDDAIGSTKTYWRVIAMLKSSVAPSQLRGYARDYWLVRMEDR